MSGTFNMLGYYLLTGTTCECGTAPQTMEHLLVCLQMGQHCTHEYLAEFNDSARHCVSYWLGRILISVTVSDDTL